MLIFNKIKKYEKCILDDLGISWCFVDIFSDKPKTKASSSKTRKKSSKKNVPSLYQFMGVIGLFIIVAKIVYRNLLLLGVVVSLLSVYVYWFADQFDQMYRN